MHTPKMSQKKVYLTWDDIDYAIECIVATIEVKNLTKDFDEIYGIPKGGTILAVLLSNYLNKPIIFDWYSVDRRTLVVDDLVDSGQTMQNLLNYQGRNGFHIEKFPSITIYNTKGSIFNPDISVWIKTKDEWIVFPWEKR